MEANTNMQWPRWPWGKRDPQEATKRRDNGIKQVVDNNRDWATRARKEAEAALQRMSYGTLFIGEDLRVACLESGLEPPSHPNAWGGVIGGVVRNALKNGHVEMAGMDWAATAQSHRRRSARYRKLY